MSALAQGQTDVEINSGVLGALVLGGWEGVTLENGDELEYTPESATAVMMDPDSVPLVEWLIAEAARITREAQERLGLRVGKFVSTTAGKKSGAVKRPSSAKSPSASA